MATLVQAALDSACLAVAGRPSAGKLIAGLFSCLPPACRTEFSFATALKFSSRRPFRIVALPRDPAEQRWIAHQHQVTVWNLSDREAAETMPMDGWARLVQRVLASGRVSFLASQFSTPALDTTLDDLPGLGLQLLEELDISEFCNQGTKRSRHHRRSRRAGGPTSDSASEHRLPEGSRAATPTKPGPVGPSRILAPTAAEIQQELEHLDDLVYEAIRGQATALDQLRMQWPEVQTILGEQLLTESREQYLRYALSVWEGCASPDGIRNPARAVQALDVMCLLFDEQ
jgi:hypothetical protein